MSTGLFQDEEDGYNLEETKYKLKLGDDAPAEVDADLAGLEGLGGEEALGGEELGGLDDLGGDAAEKPFEDEPFDAEVEADEESDPATYIQQLAGKLGQSLRKYSDEQGGPDFDLEKFAVNSVLSATHTAEMDAEDQKDIIKKVKTSGKGEGDIDVDVDVDTGGDAELGDLDVDAGADAGEEGMEDLGFDEENTEENFKIGEGKTPSGTLISEKKPNFVGKAKIINKLKENTEIKEAPVEQPTIVPETMPIVKPTRRQKPWRIKPNENPNPKAEDGQDLLMSEDGSRDPKVVETKYMTKKEAILTISDDGKQFDVKFENTGIVNTKPEAYDEPWVYEYKSVDYPDGKEHYALVAFYGNPQTHLELSGLEDDTLI